MSVFFLTYSQIQILEQRRLSITTIPAIKNIKLKKYLKIIETIKNIKLSTVFKNAMYAQLPGRPGSRARQPDQQSEYRGALVL